MEDSSQTPEILSRLPRVMAAIRITRFISVLAILAIAGSTRLLHFEGEEETAKPHQSREPEA